MAGLDTTYVPYKAKPNALADCSPAARLHRFDSTWTSPSRRTACSHLAVTTAALGRHARGAEMQEAGFKDTT